MREAAVLASFRDDIVGLDKFCLAGGDLNQRLETKEWPKGILLIEAALYSGSAAAFEWLTDRGAEYKKVSIYGNPVLVAAIERHYVEICRSLLKYREYTDGMKDRAGTPMLEVARLYDGGPEGREIFEMVRQSTLGKSKRQQSGCLDLFEKTKAPRLGSGIVLTARIADLDGS